MGYGVRAMAKVTKYGTLLNFSSNKLSKPVATNARTLAHATEVAVFPLGE